MNRLTICLKKLRLCNVGFLAVALFSMSSLSIAQQQAPQASIVGQWKFDDAKDLGKATVGEKLTPDVNDATITPSFQAVQGPTANDGAVMVGSGSFYRCNLNMDPNGADTAKRINKYTFVIDFMAPESKLWYSFFGSDNDGNPKLNDWEAFINASGKIGVGTTGYSYDTVSAKQWYRLVISADLGKSYRYYIDGQLILDGGAQKLDGRFSLPSINGANQVLFFGDNDGEDAAIAIASLTIYDNALTADEVFQLGGYGHAMVLGGAVGTWDFNDKANLTKAVTGHDLTLVGTGQKAAAGPSFDDGAVTIDKGSYYEVKHDMVAAGGERVNKYTMVVDFQIPALGAWYSIYQTDPANSNAAEIYINDKGQIGSDATGWSKKAITAGEYYRLVISADLGKQYTMFLDGDTLLAGGAQEADNRFSIDPRTKTNKVLLFADNAGLDAPINVAYAALYNRAFNATEAKGLGGFDHGSNNEVTGAGKSVYFDGTDANRYAKILKTNSDFDFGEGDFTIEAWVKPNTVVNGDPSLISDKDWNSGSNKGWVLSVRGEDWKFNMADDNKNRFDINGTFLNDGNWHHIAAIVNRNEGCKLITDTLETIWVKTADFDKVKNVNNPDLPICIAEDGTGSYSDGYKFPGEVDEIRIWKGVALDPKTLFEWRYKPVTAQHPNYANLVGYWRFNEGEGTAVADVSGKGHNAELINNPKWKVSYAPLGQQAVLNTTDIKGIWGASPTAESGGLTITGDFPIKPAASSSPGLVKLSSLKSIMGEFDNPYTVFGHNNRTNATGSGIPSAVKARLQRVWTLDVTETSVKNSSLTFDFASMGAGAKAGLPQNYVLLTSTSETGPFSLYGGTYSILVDSTKVIISNVELKDGFYTLGTKDLAASSLGGFTVGVNDKNNSLPKEFALANNFPNPFNPSTKINFALPVQAKVTLEVYNMLGQKVAELVNSVMEAGNHDVTWNSSSSKTQVSSGVYVYKLSASAIDGKVFTQTKKMMLVK